MKKFFKILGLTITSILALFIIIGIIAVKTAPDTKKEVVQAKEVTSAVATPTPTPIPKTAEELKAEAEAIAAMEKVAAELKKKTEYIEWRDSLFSVWDGSNDWMVQGVKQTMNDPKSFKHVQTNVINGADLDSFTATMTFRGTNAFGGVVTNRVTATFHKSTNNVTDFKFLE